MGREFELKYQASPRVLEELQKDFSDFSTISMETTYLDTPQGDFSRRRWMLRRRLENSQAVYCLKIPLADGSRGEWECPGENQEEALAALAQCPVPETFSQLMQAGVAPVCGAKFTRLAKTLDLPGCQVELALDQGAFLAGQKQQPFAEVEVELKSGSQAAAMAFAAQLASRYKLTPEKKSKAQRARELGETK